MTRSSEYSEPKDESSTARLLSSDDDSYTFETPQERPKSHSWSTALCIIAFVLSLVTTNVVSVIITLQAVRGSQGSRTVSEPPGGVAPLVRSILADSKPTRFNTPFYNRENSTYREHESADTEAAWLELTQIRM